MSASFAIQTVIEIVLSVLLIIGFIYEEKVIAFEKALGKCIRIRLSRYLRKKTAQKSKPTAEKTRTSPRYTSPRYTKKARSGESNAQYSKRELKRFVA